jgi:glycosyltransferase involved in cell wall biosynthesis
MPMKIAIVRPDCTVLSREYYNSQELGLAVNLAKLGVSVDVYYAGNVAKVTREILTKETDAQVTLIQLPFVNIPLIGQGFYPGLINELKISNYDLIQVNEYNDLINYVAIRYASRNNIPAIIYQGMYKNLSGRFNRIYTWLHDRFLLPKVLHSATRAYGKTDRAIAFLISKGFIDCDVLPVGLDTSPFLIEHTSTRFSRDILSIPENHRILIYIGNFETRRNIEFLLALAESLKSAKITFIFVGAGEIYSAAEISVKTNNLINVRLLNRIPQNQLSQIYNLADIFLLASDYEIYGMVLIEAMYHGVTVVSTRTAGSESLVRNNIDGLIVENLDIQTWKSEIVALCGNTERLVGFKRHAKQKINNSLLWRHIAQHYLDTILLPLMDKKE